MACDGRLWEAPLDVSIGAETELVRRWLYLLDDPAQGIGNLNVCMDLAYVLTHQ